MNEEFREFLIKAKQATYANGNAKKVNSSRSGSNDYHYEEDINGKKYIYHDTYFGGTCFMGEEVVYIDSDVPIWGMNYYGITKDITLSEEAMDKALRPALIQVGNDDILPLRGPKTFQNGEYLYKFLVNGILDNFQATEKIYKNNRLVYELHAFGGKII